MAPKALLSLQPKPPFRDRQKTTKSLARQSTFHLRFYATRRRTRIQCFDATCISARTNHQTCPIYPSTRPKRRLFPSMHTAQGRENGCNHHFVSVMGLGFCMQNGEERASGQTGAAYVLCYVGHLMSGLRPYFFTSGHISDLIGDIPAVKSSKLPCSMFFIAQTFTISQGEQRGVKIDLVSTTIISATILLFQNGFLAPR